jgi:hypothetical protein
MRILRQRTTSLSVGLIAIIAGIAVAFAGGAWIVSAVLLFVIGAYLISAAVLRRWPVERL